MRNNFIVEVARNSIKTNDGFLAKFTQGNKDGWCVKTSVDGGKLIANKDVPLFKKCMRIANIYGKDKFYGDFCNIYDLTEGHIDTSVVSKIKEISYTYGNEYSNVFRLFSILYMEMIAENHHERVKIGKAIKRLAIEMVIVSEVMDVELSVEGFRNVDWFTLNKMCIDRGFGVDTWWIDGDYQII